VKSRKSRTRRKTRKYTTRFPMTRSVTTYGNNSFLPNVKYVTMDYFQNIGMVSSMGTPTWHNFNLASIYDPTITTHSLDHRPWGYDEAKALYSRYCVIGCDIDVLWTQLASNNVGHYCQILLDKDNADSGLLSTRLERTRGKGVGFLRTNNNAHVRTKLKYNPNQFFGLKDLADDHQMHAAFGNTPIKYAYLKVALQSEDSVSTSTQIIYAKVHLRFRVALLDPLPQSGS